MAALKERPNAIFAAFVGMAILLALQVQSITRQAATERRMSAAEGRVDRIEQWMVQDRQTQAERHEDVMKTLSMISTSEARSVEILNFVAAYYRRAEARP